MGKLVADITMSLDGFITGPDDAPGRGRGERGEALHNWVMGARLSSPRTRPTCSSPSAAETLLPPLPVTLGLADY